MDPGPYYVVRGHAVDDQELSRRVDPFGVYQENDFSSRLHDFAVEPYEWSDLSSQSLFFQP